MTKSIQRIVWSCGLLAGAAFGQGHEFGVIGGYAVAPTLTLSGPPGSAQAGFRNGGAVGVYLGDNQFNHFGGEIRYLYRSSTMKLSSGGTTVEFGAHTQIVNMDLLGYFPPADARVRAFVAIGGGVKLIQGTGTEASYQPLHDVAALTKTLQVQPTGDVGAGVKISLSRHLRMRVEVRDYVSMKPDKVIAAAPGFQMAGLLHDIMGLAALSYTW